jgi:hypothetical protein
VRWLFPRATCGSAPQWGGRRPTSRRSSSLTRSIRSPCRATTAAAHRTDNRAPHNYLPARCIDCSGQGRFAQWLWRSRHLRHPEINARAHNVPRPILRGM